MKKVLHVITTPFTLNGISSVVKNYTGILADKYQFDFLLCRGSDTEGFQFIKSIGGKVVVVNINRNRKPIKYMKELSKELKKRNYDAVHVHGNSGTMFFDIHAAKMVKVPMRIAHCHSTSSVSKLLHSLLKPFLNMELTHCVACSKEASKWIFTKDAVILNNAIKTENYGFSAESRNSLRKELGVDGKFVILMVGHFTREKNFGFMIDRFAEVVSKKPDSALVIVGDGKLRGEYEKQIAELGLSDKVIMPGKKSDANRYYSMADAFVLPSVFEGLGMVLVEAQGSGVPCFASMGVPKEANVADGVTYLSLENPKDWTDALLNVKVQDREKVSAEAISKIKAGGYDVAENAKVLDEIYGG